MADGRKAEAWVNSARMSGAVHMYVEGASDERFWNKFIDTKLVKIQVCHGCGKVEEVVEQHIKEGVMSFLAIIDSDFHRILGSTPQKTNLFITDDHDLEMMMYHNNRAFAEMKNSIDRGYKIASYTSSGHDILKETIEITNDIGYCRLANKKNGWGMKFSIEDEETHDIVRPEYKDILENASGNYLGDTRLVSKVFGFNKKHKLNPPLESVILEAMRFEKRTTYDDWQFSNGHDVSCLLPYIIRRRCKHRNKNMDQEYIESVLYAAYEKQDFVSTQLYASLNDWGKKHKIKLFK